MTNIEHYKCIPRNVLSNDNDSACRTASAIMNIGNDGKQNYIHEDDYGERHNNMKRL